MAVQIQITQGERALGPAPVVSDPNAMGGSWLEEVAIAGRPNVAPTIPGTDLETNGLAEGLGVTLQPFPLRRLAGH